MNKDFFLSQYEKYQLGHLVTEQTHPLTQGLSNHCHEDLAHALQTFQKVDLGALELFKNQIAQLTPLKEAIHQTLNEGKKVFLCGCGATGRLSLLLESLWRQKTNRDNVVSMMAGGDVAMVHSLEGFEDYPQYGERHLLQLGFREGDLLVASSEGGETPYVIGAVEAAAKISKKNPYFLFCNPTDLLLQTVERSRNLLNNKLINSLSLCVGPMALAGSTRLQASTVLQLAIGLCLLEDEDPLILIDDFIRIIKGINYSVLKPMIEKEADIYQEKSFVMYTPRAFSTTVFTDTTERAPTFSLPYFEDSKGTPSSWCYVLIPEAENAKQAWQKLLARKPRALEWPRVDSRTTDQYLHGFDFSRNILDSRQDRLGLKRQHLFQIDYKNNQFLFSLAGEELVIDLSSPRALFLHTALKMLMNAHSTLLMGRMNRFESNIMTWVRPSNGKLIDRATRYIQILLKEKAVEKTYLEIVHCLFDELESLQPHQSIVMKVVKRLES